MTRQIHYRDSREAMNAALDIAEDSNCNSRHLGTVIVDEEGRFIASGYNFTADPVCLQGFCHKRTEEERQGHSNYCHAIHSEEMAAKKVIILENMGRTLKRPLTAVCAMGHPCTYCLNHLQAANVERLVLLKDTFYTDFDKQMWDYVYADFFQVEILP